MIEAFHGEFTFLKFLSILAFLTTVGLFFCGIPICRQIWKRKDTNEISGAPFLMGVLGGTCWCVYGYLKNDQTVLYVTGAQILLYSTYTVFYWCMTKQKLWITLKVAVLLIICSSLVGMVHFFGHKIFHPLGIICMTLNTMDFGAPLAGLRVVIRRRATSTLPLPLCIANFMVSSEWFLYGLLVHDFYLITPNGIGSLLAFAQLILFVVLPRKPNQRALVMRIYDHVRGCCTMDNSLDIESAAVVPVGKNIDKLGGSVHRISRHRWSSRVITNVVGEVENVIQKVQMGDQFAYSNKFNNEETSSNSSGSGVGENKKEGKENAAVLATLNEMDMPEFAQSGRSLKMPNQRTLQKLAANFATSAAPNFAGYCCDETDNEDMNEEISGNRHTKKGAEMQAEENTTSSSDESQNGIIEEDVVFPITIRDVNQLLRLSRRISKSKQPKHCKTAAGNANGSNKNKYGFGCSLQQQHYKAMRHRQNDDVPIIAEEEDGTGDGGAVALDRSSNFFAALARHRQQLKRANSEPSVWPEVEDENEGRQQIQRM